jgi:hypothetical protein
VVPAQTEPLITFADCRACAMLRGAPSMPDGADDLLESTFAEPCLPSPLRTL